MITLKELAERIQGNLIGDSSITISSVDDIGLASNGSVSFAFLPKYKKAIHSSKAAAFIVLSEEDLDGNSGIVVEDPYLAMISVLDFFDKRPVPEFNISNHSNVHDSVKISTNLHIGSFSVVEKDVVLGENIFIGNGVKINAGCIIGDNSIIYDNVVLYDNTVVGKDCIINAGTVIGSDGFGYHTAADKHHKIPHIKSVIIGNEVEIGSACTIDRGSIQDTTIGDCCKFDNQVHLAHNVSIGKACLLAGGVFIGGSTKIEDFVTIAGKSDIGPHITLGKKSVIAARSCVLKSLAGSEMYAGNPARPIKEKQKRDAIYTRFELLEKRLKKDAS